MSYGAIYKITNKKTGKCYIGKSKGKLKGSPEEHTEDLKEE